MHAAAIMDCQDGVSCAQEHGQIADISRYVIDPLLFLNSLVDVVNPPEQSAALMSADAQTAFHPRRERTADRREYALHAEVLGRYRLSLEMRHNHRAAGSCAGG
jgi:hypothetical protein